ncbi:DMT family transporter [Neobacillus sp. D3-1R]|uniref:DMT family transporter n=1 Tax=Neobacillus sp. D3-1R TaxID=3445778 RepID=UPI003F9FA748
MSWLYLVIAGVFEMLGVVLMHRLHQKRNWQSLLYLILGFGGSFLFLSLAMKDIPMGTAYAVWTGIGASGGAILGIVLYGESSNWKRVLFIAMVLVAAVGLKLVS